MHAVSCKTIPVKKTKILKKQTTRSSRSKIDEFENKTVEDMNDLINKEAKKLNAKVKELTKLKNKFTAGGARPSVV